MLKAVKDVQGKKTLVTLTGEIDDRADFDSLLGAPTQEMHFNLAGINRINSTGTKAWITYIEKAVNKGVRIRLMDCSPPIVEQLNLISNFAGGGEVESIQSGYYCENCDNYFAVTSDCETIVKLNFQVADKPCPKCKSPASFDDIPSEYFAFLQKKK